MAAALGLVTVVAAAQQASRRAEVPAADPARGAGGMSAYAVGGIDVDVTARSLDEARRIAWTQAMRRAWPQLWSRLTGQPAVDAPALSDGQIDAMVTGVESQGEQFSATRYIAKLGVVFDRSRAAAHVGGAFSLLQSPPMLLLPVAVDAGVATLYQADTPWRQAWARWRGNITPIDYVLAPGAAADNLWLNGWQAGRRDRAGWRSIMARFDTVDVLVAEAHLERRFPGGPVRGLFIARHGPDGLELGRFTLVAASEDRLPAMLDQAVRRIDEFYGAALRAGQLRAEASLALDALPLMDEPLPPEAAPPAPGPATPPATPPAGAPAAPSNPATANPGPA